MLHGFRLFRSMTDAGLEIVKMDGKGPEYLNLEQRSQIKRNKICLLNCLVIYENKITQECQMCLFILLGLICRYMNLREWVHEFKFPRII